MNPQHLHLKPSNIGHPVSRGSPSHLATLPVSSPALSITKGALNKIPIPPSKPTPFKNLTNQESLRSILSHQNFNIRTPSLFQGMESGLTPISLNDLKYFTEANTSRKRHERTKSDHPNKENYEESFALTVKEAYDLQSEKENAFMKEKLTLEQEIISETELMNQITKAIEFDESNKEKIFVAIDETMAQLEKIELKSLERDDPIWIDAPLSWTNFENTFKGLGTATRNLRETLQKMATKVSDDKEKTKLEEAERELGILIEKISILTHKLTEIEDKKMQVKEGQQMVEEDINSHEVALTESIFLHEEASDVIEALKFKDPDAFENAKREIVFDRQLLALEFELQEKKKAIQNEIEILAWNEKEAETLLRKLQENSKEISTIKEKAKILDKEMFDPKSNVFSRVQTALRMISPNTNWEEFLNFFKIFEVGSDLETDDKAIIIKYQNELIEEVLYVIRQTQAIESLESITTIKPRTSVPNQGERRSSRVLEALSSNKEVQNEILNKKLDLNEKLAIFREKRSESMEIIENNIRRKYDFIPYCEASFYDLMRSLDSKLRKLAEDTIAEIASRAQATWKAYMFLAEQINKRQGEIQGVEEDLERVRRTIKEFEESIENYKNEVESTKNDIDMIQSHLNLLQEKHFAAAMKNNQAEDLFSNEMTSEKLLEREHIQTRRGSLIKLKKDFGSIESKIRDWRKMKKDIIESEDLIKNLEIYKENIEENVENELKIAVKRSKGQVNEFKMKSELAQRYLLEALEQKEEVIRKLEESFNPKFEKSREMMISVFSNTIECKGLLCELLKEIRGKILKGFVENLLQGIELSCIEMGEFQKIKEQVEKLEAQHCTNQDSDHSTILQNELTRLKSSIEEKKAHLLKSEREAEKYRHFYEVSNELMKVRSPSIAQSPATSILSASMRSLLYEAPKSIPISPIPIPGKTPLAKNMSVLDSSKLSAKIDTHRKTAPMQDSLKHEYERRSSFMTPTVFGGLQLDSQWIKETEPLSLENFSGKTQSTSGNCQSTNTKSNDSDKQLNPECEIPRPTEGRLTCGARPDKIPKSLEICEEEHRVMISQFEAGFIVYKRFAESNKVEERVTVCLSIKGKTKPKTDLVGYGRRIFKLNRKDKTIEVLKMGPGSRSTVECKYDWTSLKKVVLQQKTLEALKERPPQFPQKSDDVKEEAFVLKLSIDVVNKGRIDLLMWNIWHVLTLWNIVNKISTQGGIPSILKK